MVERTAVQPGAVHDRPRRQDRFLFFLRPSPRPHRQPHPGHPAAGVEHQPSGLSTDQHLVGFGRMFGHTRCSLQCLALPFHEHGGERTGMRASNILAEPVRGG